MAWPIAGGILIVLWLIIVSVIAVVVVRDIGADYGLFTEEKQMKDMD